MIVRVGPVKWTGVTNEGTGAAVFLVIAGTIVKALMVIGAYGGTGHPALKPVVVELGLEAGVVTILPHKAEGGAAVEHRNIPQAVIHRRAQRLMVVGAYGGPGHPALKPVIPGGVLDSEHVPALPHKMEGPPVVEDRCRV
ncbi:uncharacterized protein LOC134264019 [Saccostrea cucullata]|uniref:uncharacterized protein LOC134264019 n=1 Tax=Saccostrea cuccullata TaxID=36930 RepID=UPI002ED481FB